ncbi:MAG TPA: 3-deoxy-7-phosphoheptulonate synthase [Vicinamibacteria bacterium]|nr:3-deoxy-7-phosphoheptulonate synthase [Vicinamibacteria bacterium]
MLIVMRQDATRDQIRGVVSAVEEKGLRAHPIPGAQRTAIGVTGNKGALETAVFEALPGVLEVIPVSPGYKLVSREVKPEDTVVDVGGVPVGGPGLVVVAGPCAVESREQLLTVARRVKEAGAHILRGGAFKPRTSPYSFQGLGEEGLRILAEARELTGLPVMTEAVDVEGVDLVERYADAVQIGARNMQNFSLLKRAGRSSKPVLLKRGMSATLEEFLMSAEYILSEGNYQVILCERGVRTFSDFSRNTLDLSVVPAVKRLSHLPILVDPSHGTGRREKVAPLSRAAAAVGADGVMVEVHHDPAAALSDGPQSITPEMFEALVREIRQIAPVIGRRLS